MATPRELSSYAGRSLVDGQRMIFTLVCRICRYGPDCQVGGGGGGANGISLNTFSCSRYGAIRNDQWYPAQKFGQGWFSLGTVFGSWSARLTTLGGSTPLADS